MILRFATKRNANGNRKYLIINTAKKQYAKESARWYSKEDFFEIKSKDIRMMLKDFEDSDYVEVDNM